MKVRFLCVAEIDIGNPDPDDEPQDLAQEKLDAYRDRAAQCDGNEGVAIFRVRRKDEALENMDFETGTSYVEED